MDVYLLPVYFAILDFQNTEGNILGGSFSVSELLVLEKHMERPDFYYCLNLL